MIGPELGFTLLAAYLALIISLAGLPLLTGALLWLGALVPVAFIIMGMRRS